MKTYELTLTPNYVSDWTLTDAIRELIQNGLDQEVSNEDSEFLFVYENSSKIKLINRNSELEINTLLLGESNKTNDSNTIGQFGEGYKIASLVLTRLNKPFVIYNNGCNEIWKCRFKNSKRWKSKILCYEIENNRSNNNDLVIEIGDISESEYEEIKKIWLNLYDSKLRIINTEYGDLIISDDTNILGNIYVNGLFVTKSNNLKYAYNFKPEYVKLERDRKTCNSWDIQCYTAKIIAEAANSGDLEINDLVKIISSKSSDLNLLSCSYNSSASKLKELIVNKFIELNGDNSIPVCDQSSFDLIKNYGGEPIIVSSTEFDILKDYYETKFSELKESYIENSEISLKERFLAWLELYDDHIDSYEAIDTLKQLINELK